MTVYDQMRRLVLANPNVHFKFYVCSDIWRAIQRHHEFGFSTHLDGAVMPFSRYDIHEQDIPHKRAMLLGLEKLQDGVYYNVVR